MKKRSIIALILSLSFVASACSSKPEDSTSESNTDTTVAADATDSAETTAPAQTEETETMPEETEPVVIDPSMLEYQLVWEDNFDGTELDMDSWGYETHEPGWVNNELQKYVAGEECVWIEDGDLVIQALKIVDDETGEVTYHSGRVNTRMKHDFEYGRIEARIKFPEGKGFLPAFWMMPKSESLYGSWPRCGEIDIAEVLGHDTGTTYGTIHYGIPHNENQNKFTLEDGTTFSSDYHVFAIEWEPGCIKWFVDDVEIGCEQRWFSAMVENSKKPYPAPFDQEFYIILNLAVGGNWPGDPDETTLFDEHAQMRVDWVRVYQRGYYDENVEMPEVEYEFREADADGNFVVFDEFEFLNMNGGVGSADIATDAISISIDDNGDVDYSIQLVNAGIPAVSGTTYEVTFEARADEDRVMIVDVSQPDNGYSRLLEDTRVSLTTDWQTFTYSYTVNGDSDDNSRLEFNMGHITGADSTANIQIRNVSLKEA